MHLTVQEICALSGDFTDHYFLLPPGMSRCQWSDEAMSINKIWLRPALGHVYIITNLFFANYYIWSHSLPITRPYQFCSLPPISFTADNTIGSSLLASTVKRPTPASSLPAAVKRWGGNAWFCLQLSCCELELILQWSYTCGMSCCVGCEGLIHCISQFVEQFLLSLIWKGRRNPVVNDCCLSPNKLALMNYLSTTGRPCSWMVQ